MRIPLLPLAFAVVSLTALCPRAGRADSWREVPAGIPADSLPGWFRSREAASPRGADASGLALSLGQFHYARGEYLQALAAFSRAADRSSGGERGEARYWQGLAATALGRPGPAREAFEDAARLAPARRTLAQMGAARCLVSEGRPREAEAQLRRVVSVDAGEAGPSALSTLALLAEGAKHPEEARALRARLVHDYPTSPEAARLIAAPAAPGPAAAGSGGVRVQIGAFADAARARALVSAAQRAGFSGASVDSRPGGPGRPGMFVVFLGEYPGAAEAEAALEKAGHALGVSGQVVTR